MPRFRRHAALLAAVTILSVLGASPAWAQQSPPTPVLTGTVPALPPSVLLQVRQSGADEMVAVNPTPVPLVVSAPDGTDFLRISANGVETNAASPFTTASRFGPDTRVPAPTVTAPRWQKVSDDVSWRWFDPRLRPAGTVEPGGGREDVTRVVGRWSIPMHYGDTPVSADGTLELRPEEGWFRTVADPSAAGTVVVVEGEPPRVNYQPPAGEAVTVLGAGGEDFLRRNADGGWEASLDSDTLRLSLIADRKPVPAGSGWVAYPGGASVAWSDERLRRPADVGVEARSGGRPTDVASWRIPVRIGTETTDLTGVVQYTPRAGAATDALGPTERRLALGAGVLLLAVLLAALVARDRRLRRPEDGGTRGPRGATDPTDPTATDPENPDDTATRPFERPTADVGSRGDLVR